MNFIRFTENDASSSTGRSGSKQYGWIIPSGSDKEATDKASSSVTSDENLLALNRSRYQ